MTTQPRPYVSLHGRALGIGPYRNLVSNDINITAKCADASITATPGSGATTIVIQLKDATGADIDYVETVQVALFTSSAMTAFATTGGSTGLSITDDGALLAVVAKKLYWMTSEADGDLNLTYTDNAQEATYLALYLPTGKVVGAAITTTA